MFQENQTRGEESISESVTGCYSDPPSNTLLVSRPTVYILNSQLLSFSNRLIMMLTTVVAVVIKAVMMEVLATWEGYHPMLLWSTLG